jgi:multidrug efflux pump subunit AcrB
LRLSGKRIDTIYRMRDLIEEQMQEVPGIINIRDDWGEWTKKLEVEINQEQAKRAGFTSRDIAGSLRQMSGIQATEFREGKEIIPVEIRAEGSFRNDLGRVESLNMYSYTTSMGVPLLQLARVHLVWQPSDIRRRDKVRTMTIKADLSPGLFASDVLAVLRTRVRDVMEGDLWVSGYNVEFGGEDEESAKAMGSILEAVPLALSLLALVLIAQFNSIRRPLIIALTIPPMFIGIVYGLLLTREPFGFMAFLGMISLMGIIVNNAIMMIDQIEIERAVGQTPQNAITVAAQKRLRPIIMTTVTTVVGLIPLSISGGDMWRPMANTIIFGLAFSTVLTLLLCPVLYAVLFRVRFKDYQWDPEALKATDVG